MKKINICMSGGGLGSGIGESHRLGIVNSNLFTLVAGCFSQSLEKTWKLGQILGLDQNRCYSTFNEMIDQELQKSDGAKAVVIATPDTLHFSQAKYALEKGMHVICEKPITLNTKEARTLWDIAYEKNLLFGTAFTWNGSPYIEEAKQMVEHGKIGKVRAVIAKSTFDLGFKLVEADESDPRHKFSWRFKNSYGKAGTVSDVGTHVFQYTNYISGLLPKKLCAKLETVVAGRESDDTNAIILDYGNHTIGSLFISSAALACDESMTIEIIGEKGTIKIEESEFGKAILYTKIENQDLTTRTYSNPDPKYYFSVLYKQYAEAILNNTCRDYDSYISIKHGFQTMAMVEAALLSTENSQWEIVNYTVR